MARELTAVVAAIFLAVWPGLLVASTYAIRKAVRFHRSLRRAEAGRLVLLTVIGWVGSLVGAALVSSFYLARDPRAALPIVVPVVVLWAGSLILAVRVIHRWGQEAIGLESYYLEIEQMDRLKSQFINNVAHELNTPITPMRLQMRMLADGKYGDLADRQRACIQVLERNLDRLGILVDQVVLASRVQSGGLRLEPQDVDWAAVVAAGVEDARNLPGAPQVPVSIRLEPGVTARCDLERTRYVVAQATAQAIRDCPEDGEVTVEATAQPAKAVLRITASGRGSKGAFRGLVDGLEPWSAERGLGLELFIARGLVERQAGRLWVERRESQGRQEETLTCTLPAGRPLVG